MDLEAAMKIFGREIKPLTVDEMVLLAPFMVIGGLIVLWASTHIQ